MDFSVCMCNIENMGVASLAGGEAVGTCAQYLKYNIENMGVA